jgi:hypothetical protein
MEDRKNPFRTGERVPESGEYACEAGDKRRYEADETFAACPVSNEETTWNRADDDKDGC